MAEKVHSERAPWGAEGARWQREALPAAAGGAKRRSDRPTGRPPARRCAPAYYQACSKQQREFKKHGQGTLFGWVDGTCAERS